LILAVMLVAACASRAVAQPGAAGAVRPPQSPRNANYTITARLDPATRTITGSELIVWRNITSAPATDLQFHLYWNAWKNTRSTFMRERALAGAAGPARAPNEWGRIDVSAITIAGVDRTASKR